MARSILISLALSISCGISIYIYLDRAGSGSS
jgi:hypothetical protein